MSTIAVPTVLVAFNWPAQSNRYQRVARFVDYLFSRIDRLQAPGFDPKWKSINLAATVPGLARFSAAQTMAGSSVATGAGIAMKTPSNPAICCIRDRKCGGASTGTNDPVAQLRACSMMERAERLECLDKLSRNIAPPARPAPAQARRQLDCQRNHFARGLYADRHRHHLCRAARTAPRCSCQFAAAVAAPNWWSRDQPLSRSGDDYAISYRINDDQPVRLAAGSPSFGTGRCASRAMSCACCSRFPTRAASPSISRPERAPPLDGSFPLSGLKMVREKVAAACKWPHAISSAAQLRASSRKPTREAR